VVAAIAAILGYPLYRLVSLSFQRYGLAELIQRQGEWIGLDNYRSVLSDSVFWDTVVRTVVFTVANVGLTMVLGTLFALLLVRLATPVRILLLAGLVLVWSMPAVVAVQVWYWMTNFQNGVVNYILTQLHVGDFDQHDWYSTTFWKLTMVTLLIVWGALPFVTVTMYAALSQVPHELVEAAKIDGAGAWRVFRDITFPTVKPIVYILTSLSII
jgi:N,N'-diacetylchitobiose transport system permease protein